MKRFMLLILASILLVTGQVFAQDAGVITLSDSNPSVSAAVSLPPNATGVVTIDLNMAAVTLTDANGGVIFSSVDSRVHHLEVSIAPNSGSHTLTVQRLPGATLASVRVGSQATFTPVTPAAATALVDTASSQQQALSLDATHPVGQVALDVQPNTTGLIATTFPGAAVTSQLTDSSGALIATTSHDVDGFSALLDAGQYNLSVQAISLNTNLDVAVSATPTDQFALLSAPTAPIQASASIPCQATIATHSVNLRSGPGTGYTVLNAAFQGDQLAVGGVNPEQNWIVVAQSGGSSAWVSRNLTQLDGDCGQLRVFNIPLRDAPSAPVIVQSAPSAPASVTTAAHHEDDGGSEDDNHNSGGDD